MTVMAGNTSVGANSTSVNVLAGLQQEFLERPSSITILNTTTAIGLTAQLIVGGRVIVDDQAISTSGVYPKFPDDVLADTVGRARERLILRYRNSTAGALVATWKLNISALG